MDFYDLVYARHTTREFTEQPVDMAAVRRIVGAGLQAPSNDHLRNWEFVVVTDEAQLAQILKKIPKTVSPKRLEFIINSMRLKEPCQREMYEAALPKQREMLGASSCLVLPFFKQKSPLLQPKSLSSLNAFASVWCCIENMLLAATAEGLGCALRIPMAKEVEHIAEVLQHPKEYTPACLLSIGHPAKDAEQPAQMPVDLESKLHLNTW